MRRGFEILLSKLSGLQETVTMEGYESEIMAYSERWPELHIYIRPETGDELDSDTAVVSFLPDGSDEFRFFLINAECALDTKGLSPGFVQLCCNMLNEQTTAGFAYPVEREGLVMYRAVLPEAELPISTEVFALFLKLFTAHLKKLKELLMIEGEAESSLA